MKYGKIITAGSRIVTAGTIIITAGRRIVTAGTRIITAGSRIAIAATIIITTGSRIAIAVTRIVTSGRRILPFPFRNILNEYTVAFLVLIKRCDPCGERCSFVSKMKQKWSFGGVTKKLVCEF
jgi:hypothetical protein